MKTGYNRSGIQIRKERKKLKERRKGMGCSVEICSLPEICCSLDNDRQASLRCGCSGHVSNDIQLIRNNQNAIGFDRSSSVFCQVIMGLTGHQGLKQAIWVQKSH